MSLRIPALLGSLWLGLACPSPVRANAPLSLGPAPRDAEGRFENRAGPIPRAGCRTTLPFYLRRAWANLAGRSGAAERVPNDGAFLRENAGHSVPTVTWVGHSTLLVQMDGASFLTDPIWSRVASPVSWLGPRRRVAPGLALDELPAIDFVVVSHNHYDHLDLPSLEKIARRGHGTRFLVPLGDAEKLRKLGISAVDELDWGQTRRLGSLDVTCLPSQHWSMRGARDERRALWCSWAVRGPERSFYFGGDSGYFSGFASIGEELGPFDLAALPIGAYGPQKMMKAWHLDPEQAVRAAGDLRARRALAVHWGTFDLSDEPLDEPARRFRAAARAQGLNAWVLRVGEIREF